MFFLLTAVVFFSTSSFLILSRQINVFPEVFFLSWLIKKGLLPYRDFFDDHGFLLQWLLSPLTVDKSLLLIKGAYFLLHTVNLGIVLLILKKNKSKLSYFFGGLVYVLLMFFLSENDFWFELLITSFYLIAYLLISVKKTKWKNLLIGLSIGLAALVKPTAGLMIVPIFLVIMNFSVISGFIFPILITVGYFYINSGLNELFNNLVGYNFFLAKFYRPSYFSDQKFILTSIVIILLSVFMALLSKKEKQIVQPFMFLIFSIIFLASGYTRVRLVPVAAFFTILIANTITVLKPKYKFFYLPIIVVYCLVMTLKVYQHYQYLGNGKRIAYIEDKTGKLITSYLHNNKLTNSFFILGNTAQPYYLLDQLPATYFPLRYSLVEKYFPDYEKRIIKTLKEKSINTIIMPTRLEFGWEIIPLYIKDNYQLNYNSKEFQVYLKK